MFYSRAPNLSLEPYPCICWRGWLTESGVKVSMGRTGSPQVLSSQFTTLSWISSVSTKRSVIKGTRNWRGLICPSFLYWPILWVKTLLTLCLFFFKDSRSSLIKKCEGIPDLSPPSFTVGDTSFLLDKKGGSIKEW